MRGAARDRLWYNSIWRKRSPQQEVHVSPSVLENIHSVFNNRKLRRVWAKLRAVLTIVALCFFVPFIEKDWFFIGFGVSLLGEFFQLWCFASLKKQKVLAAFGPYVVVRNPMYLGRYFILLGGILLLGIPGLYAVLPFTLLYYFYMVNRVKREEATLLEIFGQDYRDYCKRVNRFFPTFRRKEFANIWFWDWSLLVGNHGGYNLLGLIVVYAVLYSFVFLIL